jgi:hypothetical protein
MRFGKSHAWIPGVNKPRIVDLKSQMEIEIPIKKKTKYVQIFPCNLDDCIFAIEDEPPVFVSKFPGKAVHFLGKITCKYTWIDNFAKALPAFVINAFMAYFRKTWYEDLGTYYQYSGLTNKCWFIKTLELTAGTTLYNVDSLVIKMSPDKIPSYAYHNSVANKYYLVNEATDQYKVVEQEVESKVFKKTIQDWFDNIDLSDASFREATGVDGENYVSICNAIAHSWSEYLTMPLLVEAAKRNDIKVVLELLNHNIDVNQIGSYGMTALMWAASNGNIELAKALLDKEANPHLQNPHVQSDCFMETAASLAKISKCKNDKLINLIEEAEKRIPPPQN